MKVAKPLPDDRGTLFEAAVFKETGLDVIVATTKAQIASLRRARERLSQSEQWNTPAKRAQRKP